MLYIAMLGRLYERGRKINRKSSIDNNQFKKAVGLTTHNTGNAYGCSVPRLTRFTPNACMGPDHKCDSLKAPA